MPQAVPRPPMPFLAAVLSPLIWQVGKVPPLGAFILHACLLWY